MCIFKSKTLHEPNESPYYPLTISVNNCGRSCSTIDDSYVRIWIPNKVKNECESNKKRCLVQHELCECKCRLHENVWRKCLQFKKKMEFWCKRVKNKMIGGLVKKTTCRILRYVFVSVTKHVKLVSI